MRFLLASALCAAALPAQQLPPTRAERSGYTETSTHADVLAFLDSLQRLGAPIRVGTIGTTHQDRPIPYVVASRPLVATPSEARRLGRPVVYVQGNIHAGEVEGKEAVQALLRDLAFERRRNVLDSLVVVFVPIYNGDGNEMWGPQAQQRGAQQGPERVGQRPNAQQLDLNRDYIKAEAPETRASLAMFRAWDPDVFVDLHTTNGSYHGYALTYAPSLHPAAALAGATFGGAYARDSLLPIVQRRVQQRHGFPLFSYGNVGGDAGFGREALFDSVKAGVTWATYDHRPRFGTNYTGLRGRIGILSEAYSHDPFERRVKSTYAFVREVLSLTAERAPAILRLSRAADQALAGPTRPAVPIRAVLPTTGPRVPVRYEVLVPTGDSSRTEPGVPIGARRTGRYRTSPMPFIDRFTTTKAVTPPVAYALPAELAPVVERLRLHGVAVERLSAPWRGEAERFTVDSLVRAARPFQGHNEVRLEGRWARETVDFPAGAFVVRTGQALGVLAVVLLEPESDDGFTTWNGLDPWLAVGRPYPVTRVHAPVAAPAVLVP
jgi:hypothetical protein